MAAILPDRPPRRFGCRASAAPLAAPWLVYRLARKHACHSLRRVAGVSARAQAR
jgi:hypothetical protein